LYVSVSQSVSMCLSVRVFVCVCQSGCLYVSVSQGVCMCLSVRVFVCVCQSEWSARVFVCVCQSLLMSNYIM